MNLSKEVWLRSLDVPFHRAFRTFGRPVIAPFQITFAVTYKCLNLCRTCHSFKNPQGRELTAKEYAAMFDKMTFTPFCVTFTGGEPFMRDDFGKIVGLACRKLTPPLVIVETCGDRPDRIKSEISTLAGYYKDTIFLVLVSLDAVKEELDSMRGGVPQSFETVLRSYRLLKSISMPNLFTGFQVLISKYNAASGARLLEDVFMLYPDIVSLDIAYGCETLGAVAVDVMPEFDDISKLTKLYLEKLGELKGRSAVRFLKSFLARRAELELNNLRKMKRACRCLAGHAYLYIDPIGSVKDCPVAARELGDLRENQYDIERILKSETARRVRDQVASSECVCPMSAPALSNIFLSPEGYINLAGACL